MAHQQALHNLNAARFRASERLVAHETQRLAQEEAQKKEKAVAMAKQLEMEEQAKRQREHEGHAVSDPKELGIRAIIARYGTRAFVWRMVQSKIGSIWHLWTASSVKMYYNYLGMAQVAQAVL